VAEFNGRIGHLEDIESPWGNAGGVVKTIEDVEQMARTGVGWIEAGSYTLEPRIGNSPNGETVYHHDAETGETFNSLGMPNKGMDVVQTEIPEMVRIAHAHNKKMVVNVAPVSEYPARESLELVTRAYEAGADAVLLNAGCPNVVTDDGGRHEILSHNPDALWSVLHALEAVRIKFKPVFVRLSPFADLTNINALFEPMLTMSASAVFTPNTWGGNKPTNKDGKEILEVPGGMGGKSGPAVAKLAQEQAGVIADWLKDVGIDVVLSSGVIDARGVQRGIDVGAKAVAGTTFYYESQNGWQEDTGRLLSELAA
jgi:dihydroorotate dehydrogenase